ncbi:hypothetical protein DK308_15760, partial [Listeria monocytogenes]
LLFLSVIPAVGDEGFALWRDDGDGGDVAQPLEDGRGVGRIVDDRRRHLARPHGAETGTKRVSLRARCEPVCRLLQDVSEEEVG